MVASFFRTNLLTLPCWCYSHSCSSCPPVLLAVCTLQLLISDRSPFALYSYVETLTRTPAESTVFISRSWLSKKEVRTDSVEIPVREIVFSTRGFCKTVCCT